MLPTEKLYYQDAYLREFTAQVISKTTLVDGKFAAADLKKLPGIKIATPVIGGAGLHYECKVVFKQPMNPALLDPSLNTACYPSGDHHTIYYGLIEACWLE